MGWLDGLSSALTAGTQGAAGYLEGQDKGRLEAQARARQIALDLLAKRKQQEEETMGAASRANLLQDNQLNALKAGYFPVGQLRQEAAQTGGIANTGAAGLSGAANIGSGGIDLSALQPFVAKLAGSRSADLKQGSENPVTLGGQSMGFDYNRSLEGRQLQKMQDLQTMRDVEAQRKQTEAASLAAVVADRRNRAAHGTLVQDFKHTQPYSPDTDYVAALVDARGLRQVDAGQREKWLTNPTPDADGNFVQTSDRGGFRILNGKMGQKPGAGGKGGSSQGAQVPLDDMLNRFEEIAAHADRIGKGQQKLTRAYQAREGATYGIARGSASGHDIPFKTMAVASAQDNLPESLGGVDPKDPDYLRYQELMNSVRSINDDAAKVFKGRQNEESVLREIALNQPTPDDYQNPKVLAQKMDRLKNIIKKAAIDNPNQMDSADADKLFRITGIRRDGTGGRGGERVNTPATGDKRISQSEYDALVTGGMSPATILKNGYTVKR